MPAEIYDQVNDKQIKTTPIPGEAEIDTIAPEPTRTIENYPSMTSSPAGDMLMDTYFNRSVDQRTTNSEDGSKYDAGGSLRDDIHERRAAMQSTGAKIGTSILGGLLDGVGTAIEDLGYIFDVADAVDRLTGGTLNTNWFSEYGTNLKEWSQKEIPTYESRQVDGFVDGFFRWGTFREAINSAVGYGVAGAIVGYGTTKIGSYMLNNFATAASIARKNKGLSKFLGDAIPALLTNSGEGKVMALEVYETQMAEYEPLIRSGSMTEAEAIELASDAADNFQAKNVLFAAVDFMGFKNLYNAPFKTAGRPSMKTTMKKLGGQSWKEYLEETGQLVTQENTNYNAFREAEEKYGLWDGGGREFTAEGLNRDLNGTGNFAAYDKHFTDYYNTKEGKAYAEANKPEGVAGDEYWDKLRDHFEQVAVSGRMMNTKEEDLMSRSFNTFIQPQTQIEGFIGMFSSAGQWAITSGAGYKDQLKKDQEKYDNQTLQIKKAKDFVNDNLDRVTTFNELQSEIEEHNWNEAKRTASPQDKEVVETNDDTPAGPINTEDVESGQLSKEELIKANMTAEWFNIMSGAVANGTSDQLENLLIEKINAKDNRSARATKMLEEFNEHKELLKDSERYFNSVEVANAELKLKAFKNYSDIVKNDKSISENFRYKYLNTLSEYESEVKTLKGRDAQIEAFEKMQTARKLTRDIAKAIRNKDNAKIKEFSTREDLSELDQYKLARYLSGKSDRHNKISKKNKKNKTEKSEVKETPTDVETEFEKTKREKENLKQQVASKRSKKRLGKIDSALEKVNKKIKTSEGILARASAEEDTTKLNKILEESKEEKARLDKERAAVVDISYELSTLNDEEFKEKFESSVSDRISGTTKSTARVFVPKVNEAMNKTLVNKLDANVIGEIAAENIRQFQGLPIDNAGIHGSVEVRVTKNNISSNATLTKDGDIYILDVSGSKTRLESKDFKPGVISQSTSTESTIYKNGQVLVNYEVSDGTIISIGNTAMIDSIAKIIYDAVVKDTKNSTNAGVVTKDENAFDKFISDEDKAILEQEYKVFLSDRRVISIEYAEALYRNKEHIDNKNKHWEGMSILFNSPTLLSNSVGVLHTFQLKDSESVKEARIKYLDSIKNNPVMSIKILSEANAIQTSERHPYGLLIRLDREIATEATNVLENVPGETTAEVKAELIAKAIDTGLQYMESPDAGIRSAGIATMLKVIMENHPTQIRNLSDLVILLADPNITTDKNISYIVNQFNKFSQAVKDADMGIIIDSSTYSEAIDDTAPSNDEFEASIVATNSIEILEMQTRNEIENMHSKDSTIPVDRTTGINYLYDMVRDAFNKIAYLFQGYTKNFEYNELTNEIEVSFEDLQGEITWSDSVSLDTMVGDTIELSVDRGYVGNVTYNNETITWGEFIKMAKGDQQIINYYKPIKITKGDKHLGWLHQPNWPSSSTITGNVKMNIDSVSKVREKVIADGPIKTTITRKGAGKLFKLNGITNTLEALGSELAEIFIGTSDNKMTRGWRSTAKEYQSETDKTPGVIYIRLPLTSEHAVFVPLSNNILTVQQNRTLLEAIRIFESQDKTAPLAKASKEAHNQDLTTKKGFANFMKKYVRMYDHDDDNVKNLALTRMGRAGKPVFSIMSDGTIYGTKQLTSETSNVRIQVDSAMLGTQNFDVFEVMENGEIENVNDGKSYDNFVKANTRTSFGSYSHTDENGNSETVFSYQNVINFNTDFAFNDEKKNQRKESIDTTGREGAQGGDTAKASKKVRTITEKELVTEVHDIFKKYGRPMREDRGANYIAGRLSNSSSPLYKDFSDKDKKRVGNIASMLFEMDKGKTYTTPEVTIKKVKGLPDGYAITKSSDGTWDVHDNSEKGEGVIGEFVKLKREAIQIANDHKNKKDSIAKGEARRARRKKRSGYLGVDDITNSDDLIGKAIKKQCN